MYILEGRNYIKNSLFLQNFEQNSTHSIDIVGGVNYFIGVSFSTDETNSKSSIDVVGGIINVFEQTSCNKNWFPQFQSNYQNSYCAVFCNSTTCKGECLPDGSCFCINPFTSGSNCTGKIFFFK